MFTSQTWFDRIKSCFACDHHNYERARSAKQVLLRIKGKSRVWATGRPWWRFWETYISGTESPIDKRSSLVGIPISSAVYGTNAKSWQYLLWHVARAARRVSQIFRLLFLGNGWADCSEILCAIGVPFVTAYAVVTGHLCTCARADTPTLRFCVSETAWPIAFKFGMWHVGWGSLTKCLPQVIAGVHLHVRTCAPLSHKCFACCHSATVGPIALKFGMHLETH